MKNNKYIVILSLVVILLLAVFFMRGAIGVSESKIVEDARKNQKINSTWLCAKDITDEVGALLFYDSELDKHTFSIYLNTDGFSYGYFFREGGSLGSIDSGIQGFSYQGKGMALLSMNKKNVSKIQIDNGENIETIFLDPLQPFAIIIPSNTVAVALYNSNGKDISIDNISVN